MLLPESSSQPKSGREVRGKEEEMEGLREKESVLMLYTPCLAGTEIDGIIPTPVSAS